MRIAYNNLVDGATLTAASEDISFPVENVQDQRLAKPWRTTSLTSISCVVDLTTAQDVNTIAILGHTFSASATLTIEANAADSWGSPSYSTSLTYYSGAVLKFLSASETYRYWRFTVEDASNGSSYIDVGRLWLGEYLQIDPSSLLNFRVTKRRSDVVTYGRGRQKFATTGVGWRQFNLSFPRMAGTMLTSILTMYDTVGKHSSVIFCNFDSSRDYPIVEPCYCSIQDDIGFSHTRNMRFEWSMVLEEDL